ncbi:MULTISPECIES: GolD/DthD family dehydrogenase [unclassified Rothia (in: high G+C Gram-positive bacteria)]|uniref:GolD/DthD family dehydrogenase n=1 Tax=unclassified Rothia (in: high G+C Gram-positive bacteria) TaxID=2689056 RepID=UPI00195947DC|nr:MULTISPECIES: D-threitol dehydrogenase [unclassified Rothia (in: high G+C Gram-positive bacteria)]MBM7051564.1 D-threitol dehydrogenase [Rothia sp. ZJ1223]QRZ61844.1 D-threitol dehydrogenase [Rothia sp. ZJ932]
MTDFSGKIAIVTGAASGIGLAISTYLAERGAVIAGVDLSKRVRDIVADLTGQGHLGIVTNLANEGAAAAAVEEVEQKLGTPHILVNSAGVVFLDAAEKLSAEDWNKTIAVNLTASFFMAQAAGQAMLKAGYGRIINMASQASVIGLDQHVAYCASKAGVVGMTQALSLEWAPRGITVNAVSPTVVETPLGKKAWAGEKGEKAKAAIPVGRFAQPEEIAALVGYLASEEAAMITGSNMLIDGGFTAQ